VSMFHDHIEISSPGGLPYGISPEEYLSGQISMLRNPIIGNIFFRLKYIEMFGTGIKRIKFAYTSNIQKPEFKIFENSIIVILPKIEENTEILTSNERLVYEALSKGIPKSRIEIEEITKLKKDKIIRVLNRLIEKNAIQRTGQGRGTTYIKK
jgi:ATP-dependent DNA helicase RecG